LAVHENVSVPLHFLHWPQSGSDISGDIGVLQLPDPSQVTHVPQRVPEETLLKLQPPDPLQASAPEQLAAAALHPVRCWPEGTLTQPPDPSHSLQTLQPDGWDPSDSAPHAPEPLQLPVMHGSEEHSSLRSSLEFWFTQLPAEHFLQKPQSL
jgi:hypothetical protein